MPTSRRSAIWPARATSGVQIAAVSPYAVPLQIPMASSSVEKRITHAMGPKISSCATAISLSTFARTVGG